jgi:4'-phosphopantetheinyl transferase
MRNSPESNCLDPGQVHLWHIPLSAEPESIPALQTILSETETERANRFIHNTDRLRWTTAHAAARLILSRYTGMTPEALTFTNNVYGKPELESAASSLQYNFSYSQEQAVLAISNRNPVGVDLQFMPVSFDGSLIDWIASPQEIDWLTGLPPDSLRQNLLRLWVRKEALLKAAGTGLSIEPSTFSLPTDPAPFTMDFSDSCGKSCIWTLYDISDESDPLISLAACGEGHTIMENYWTPPEDL